MSSMKRQFQGNFINYNLRQLSRSRCSIANIRDNYLSSFKISFLLFGGALELLVFLDCITFLHG